MASVLVRKETDPVRSALRSGKIRADDPHLFRGFKKPVWTVAGPREPDVVFIVRAAVSTVATRRRDDDKEQVFIFS